MTTTSNPTDADAQPAPGLQPEALRIAMHLRQRAQLPRTGNLDTLSAAGSNELERQHAELSTAQAEAKHWRTNHDNVVARLRIFTQRPDIPKELADRLPWYRELVRLQEVEAALQAAQPAQKPQATPGDAVRSYRDYLSCHDGIKLGGHAMDDMALDLARIALDFKHLKCVRAADHAPLITEQSAYDMGAKGAPATEAERVLFEAWMRGHCWALSAVWDGKCYRGTAENGDYVCPRAMRTRQLFAAWRDRAALQAAPPAHAAVAVQPAALESSILDLEAWEDRSDGEPMTLSETESVSLVLQELKRLRALAAAPAQAVAVPQGEKVYAALPGPAGDSVDFGNGKIDIDWGHPAPAGGTSLYTADQMRDFADATHALRPPAQEHATPLAGQVALHNSFSS